MTHLNLTRTILTLVEMCLERILRLLRIGQTEPDIPPAILASNIYEQYGDRIKTLVRKDDLPSITFYPTEEHGVVAYTAGTSIYLGKEYFDNAPEKEKIGVIIHEITHAIQRAPKYEGDFVWMIEGLADFVRLTLGYGVWNGMKGQDPRNGGYGAGAYFFEWLYTTRKYTYDLFVDSINRGVVLDKVDSVVDTYMVAVRR